jgi:hypothetical protein
MWYIEHEALSFLWNNLPSHLKPRLFCYKSIQLHVAVDGGGGSVEEEKLFSKNFSNRKCEAFVNVCCCYHDT